MNYEFRTMPSFDKDLKRLSKKYKSLKEDFSSFKKDIATHLATSDDLGDGFRKIRLSISSKNKGKSGGARVITHEILVNIDQEDTLNILFVALYDKSEYSIVDKSVLRELVEAFY